MKNDEIISTLNNLIETCKDGEEGFLACAEDINDPKLKLFFTERAQSCASAARQLQEQVRAYGGDPETNFRELFGNEFARAYEEQLEKAKAAGKARRK